MSTGWGFNPISYEPANVVPLVGFGVAKYLRRRPMDAAPFGRPSCGYEPRATE